MTERITNYAREHGIQYREYKTYRGFKYHINFPDEWILHEKQNTGRNCENCIGNADSHGFALWRGIILGYCANCSIYDYEGQRGAGFCGQGVEVKNEYCSAYDLYLKNVDLDTIGDLAENPEDTMENHQKLKEKVLNMPTDIEYDYEEYDDCDSEEYYAQT